MINTSCFGDFPKTPVSFKLINGFFKASVSQPFLLSNKFARILRCFAQQWSKNGANRRDRQSLVFGTSKLHGQIDVAASPRLLVSTVKGQTWNTPTEKDISIFQCFVNTPLWLARNHQNRITQWRSRGDMNDPREAIGSASVHYSKKKWSNKLQQARADKSAQ